MLAGAGIAAAFASDWFVSALTPATEALHMSQDFAGFVVVAIAGNAVENVVGVQLAARNRPDFAISVIVSSALQVALFLTPVLVFASLFFATNLTLVFPTLLAIALLLSAGDRGAGRLRRREHPGGRRDPDRPLRRDRRELLVGRVDARQAPRLRSSERRAERQSVPEDKERERRSSAVNAAAHERWKRKSVITKTVHVTATARHASPAIDNAFETTSIRSLSRCRQRSRWYELGAISSTVASAVAMKAAKNTSRSSALELREPVGERNREQEREEHLHPGQRDAQLVEQLDQLAVVTVLLVSRARAGSTAAATPCVTRAERVPLDKKRRFRHRYGETAVDEEDER